MTNEKEKEKRNGSIRRRAPLAGWSVSFQEFSQVDRSGRVEAVVAQRIDFVLYSWINGQPVETSKPRRDIVSFGNSQDKDSIVALNLLWSV